MARQDKSFLSRWSQRKHDSGRSDSEPLVPVDAAVSADSIDTTDTPATTHAAESTEGRADVARASPAAGGAEPPDHRPGVDQGDEDAPALPTLADVATLTRDSDYGRFVAVGVDENVKRAALKKLFTDPHFNVMDGLDTYIDDYGKPDPVPVSVLRRLNQSKFLGLFDDDEVDETNPGGPAIAATPALVADASDTADSTAPASAENTENAPDLASTATDSPSIDDAPSPTDPFRAAE